MEAFTGDLTKCTETYTIGSIEEDTEKTYDMEVDDEHYYILGNGVISHNTISLIMDCDSTGMEPVYAPVVFKSLVGGGTEQLLNSSFFIGLDYLGYSKEDITLIEEEIAKGYGIDSTGVKPEHYAIFGTAVGDNPIGAKGHIDMVAAMQPQLSGGISKTINLDEETEVDEILELYTYAYDMGCKSITVYRDNSKAVQPLNSSRAAGDAPRFIAPKRRRMPTTTNASRYEFEIEGTKFYVHAGEYLDGSVGEIFIRSATMHGTMAGLLECFAISCSLGLQYGVPLESYIKMFSKIEFEPKGFVKDSDINFCKSPIDFVFKKLEKYYLDESITDKVVTLFAGPPCPKCSTLTQRTGSCHTCPNCGTAVGACS